MVEMVYYHYHHRSCLVMDFWFLRCRLLDGDKLEVVIRNRCRSEIIEIDEFSDWKRSQKLVEIRFVMNDDGLRIVGISEIENLRLFQSTS